MEEIILYTQEFNPFSGRVTLALRVKELPFKRVVSEDPQDFKRWNPATGRLPVLEIDGERRHDSSLIIEWLEERFPEPRLVSPVPKIAEQQRSLATWSDASFLFYWDRWRSARYPLPGDEQPPQPGLLETLRDKLGRLRGTPSGSPTRLELRELEVLDELANRMDDLVGMLGERPYFYADDPSLADLSIYGMLRLIRDGPMTSGAFMVDSRPSLARYVARLDALTSTEPEGLFEVGDRPVS